MVKLFQLCPKVFLFFFCRSVILNVSLHNIVLFQILGVGTLGVGIWLLVTDFSVREISVIIDSNLFEIGTYLILAGGGLIALLAFCGCCGTMREDRCILGFVSMNHLKGVIFSECAIFEFHFAFYIVVKYLSVRHLVRLHKTHY